MAHSHCRQHFITERKAPFVRRNSFAVGTNGTHGRRTRCVRKTPTCNRRKRGHFHSRISHETSHLTLLQPDPSLSRISRVSGT